MPRSICAPLLEKNDDIGHCGPVLLSYLPFLTLRSNGDVFLGFVDTASYSFTSSRITASCRLAGPLKIHVSDGDTEILNLNSCAMKLISSPNLAKGAPIVVIATADGIVRHHLLICEDLPEDPSDRLTAVLSSSNSNTLHDEKSVTLSFPNTCLHAVEQLKICHSKPLAHSTSSLSSWLFDPSSLKISNFFVSNGLEYLATFSNAVFRITVPWAESPDTVSEVGFVSRISDYPAIVESLMSMTDNSVGPISISRCSTIHTVIVTSGFTINAIVAGTKLPSADNTTSFISMVDSLPTLVQSESSKNLRDDVFPPSEDFVAVVQRAVAKQAQLSESLMAGKEDKRNDLGEVYSVNLSFFL